MSHDARVGPYRILRKINQGGQGSVYLGYDGRLHRRVAIKIYTQPEDRSARRVLLREARLVAGIQSARVVQVHDVITSSGHLALIMEYIPGTDLEQLLRVVRPSMATVLAVGADLAAALAAVRQQRIVHGDLKASNVLVAANGRVKLSDFGIARGEGLAEGSSGGPASPAAISPEQYQGMALDIRSDLFALGCLMYRMLTSQHPFLRNGRLDPQLLLAEDPPPLRQLVSPAMELPAGLEDLIDSMLRKDPRDRPGNTHQVRQALRSITRQVPLSAGNTLELEAQPYFRPEMPEELPLRIPSELGREGRSRLHSAAETAPWSWQNPQARPRLVLVTGALLAALMGVTILSYQLWWGRPTRVHIEAPVLQVANAPSLPAGVSVDWLVAQVKQGLAAHLGALQVSGPVGATRVTTLYAPGRSPAELPVQERLTINLRCSAEFCLLALARERDGLHYADQVSLFPDAPLGEWATAIRRTTNALFAQQGLPARREPVAAGPD